MSPGLIVAAPASGSGKTVITLALARALRRAGLRVACAKAGPDYIDPAFHAAASGRACVNLDIWAMRPALLSHLIARAHEQADLVLCEGVMGLFDGVDAAGLGSTAALAASTGWPVVLVVDVRGQAASAAALVAGFARHRADVHVAGVIFNRAGSAAHEATLRAAMAATLPGLPVLGVVRRDDALVLPDRHLGLVQARESADLDGFLDRAARLIAGCVDLAALRALARNAPAAGAAAAGVPPLGQRIAVASDDAFAFAYPWLLDAWRDQGADILPFSPLADEPPAAGCDCVYLPGGYPELHAGRIAAAQTFLQGLRDAAARGGVLYGECGGYMVLGRGLTDADGHRHALAGLLPLETSFAARKLHLGYRQVAVAGESGPLGIRGTPYRGHEFHYASIVAEGPGGPLFRQHDARGKELPDGGLRRGSVLGSFVHLIDRADPVGSAPGAV